MPTTAGLLGLNSPQPKPKYETGATNQTQLNETEKGIGGSQEAGDDDRRAPPEQEEAPSSAGFVTKTEMLVLGAKKQKDLLLNLTINVDGCTVVSNKTV